MFCNASIVATEEQKQKLEKLLKLWESKSNYLKPETLDKMRNPVQSYQQFQSDQMAKYATEVAALAQQTKITFEGYQAQHQAFVCHAMQQIMDLQQQKQNLEQQPVVQQPQPSQNIPNANASSVIPLETIQASLQQTIQNLSQTLNSAPLPQNSQQYSMSNPPNPEDDYGSDNFVQMNTSIPPPNLSQQNNIGNSPVFSPPPDITQQPPPIPQNSNGIDSLQFSQPPPGFFPPPGMFPDFSKPPPGFLSKQEPLLEELMPTAPYYDLPAGLMVPLVKVGLFSKHIQTNVEITICKLFNQSFPRGDFITCIRKTDNGATMDWCNILVLYVFLKVYFLDQCSVPVPKNSLKMTITLNGSSRW